MPADFTNDRGHIALTHRRVWVRPISEDFQSLELSALKVDVLLGVSPTHVAQFRDRHRTLVSLLLRELLLDAELDRQPMTVPARNIGGLKSDHVLVLDDDVLQDLVERVPNVNITVGIGRSVVQEELALLRGAVLLDHAFVHTIRDPLLHLLGLALGQLPSHREVRNGEIQRRFVVHSGLLPSEGYQLEPQSWMPLLSFSSSFASLREMSEYSLSFQAESAMLLPSG